VADVEFFGGFGLDGGEDALALVHVHVGNARVQAERVVAVAERPDVHVVNFKDAFDRENGAGHFFHAAVGRTAFEQDVRRLAQDADARPENEQADGETEKRIDPSYARHADYDCADDDGDVGKRVAKIVNEDAAQI